MTLWRSSEPAMMDLRIDASTSSGDELPRLDVLLANCTEPQRSGIIDGPSSGKNPQPANPRRTGRRVRRLDKPRWGSDNPLIRPWIDEKADIVNIAPEDELTTFQHRRPRSFKSATFNGACSYSKERVNTYSTRKGSHSIQLRNSSLQEKSSGHESDSQSNAFDACHDQPHRNSKFTQAATETAGEGICCPRILTANRAGGHGRSKDEEVPGTQSDCISSDAGESAPVRAGNEPETSGYEDKIRSDSDVDCPINARLSGLPIKHDVLEFQIKRSLIPCSRPGSIGHIRLDDQGAKPVKAGAIVQLAPTFCEADQQPHRQPYNDIPVQRSLGCTSSGASLQVQNSEEQRVDDNIYSTISFPSLVLSPLKKGSHKGLASPRKLPGIPDTAQKFIADDFWSQGFVSDWNTEHSTYKPMGQRARPPLGSLTNANRATKKTFASRKHQLAIDFLVQLDIQITEGKIAKLTESTGGIKLVWTKTLNTTAGRANWRQETTRTMQAGGTEQEAVQNKHYATIELAEKIIDDELRLHNVLAHEFCHLANFMINGITNSPHGKEFKVWAAKCSEIFGAQGVTVTTKHTYEIAFKYVWACVACGTEYKRHSKSIDPRRHRCGSCKSSLKQTRPVPRGASTVKKPNEYQLFMKEHMKIVRSVNPGIKQKEAMIVVAEKWANRTTAKLPEENARINGLAVQLGNLSLTRGEGLG